MNAQQAIERSIYRTEIVHIDWSASNQLELDAACDDSTQIDKDTCDYWGVDACGNEWRVILHGSAP